MRSTTTCCLLLASLSISLAACAEHDSSARIASCDATTVPHGPTCVGASAPSWQLPDIQPQSSRFDQTYGLEAFSGRPLLVALFSAWCGFCRSQAGHLEQLQSELASEGVELALVAVNGADAEAEAELLVDLVSYPVFQDSDEVDAWAQQGGQRDDLFVYDAAGKLSAFLPYGGAQETRLDDPQGHDDVKAAVLAAVAP